MEKTFHLRKQFLINKPFQYHVIWRFILVVIVSVLLSHLVALAYIKIREILDPALLNMMYFTNDLNPSLGFTRIWEVLWLPMLISSLTGVLLVMVLGLFYSHRIAGPMFNLKRMMQQAGAGHLGIVMKIRKNDEFHDVENAFNLMIRELDTRVQAVRKSIRQLPKEQQQKIEAVLQEQFGNFEAKE
jgi:methyl-accepting chemotaxis protein